MQMAHNVSSKLANIFLADEGRLWYSVEKPPWCRLAAPTKEEVIGPKALAAALQKSSICAGDNGQIWAQALDHG